VQEGAQAYYLLTSVAGTAVPQRGSMDTMDAALAKYTAQFGIPIHIWWRADLDARMDAAPTELKWAYSDMFAGQDLVRYLIDGAGQAAHDHALRTLAMKVIATQWDEDAPASRDGVSARRQSPRRERNHDDGGQNGPSRDEPNVSLPSGRRAAAWLMPWREQLRRCPGRCPREQAGHSRSSSVPSVRPSSSSVKGPPRSGIAKRPLPAEVSTKRTNRSTGR
jgi:hypothetical protein